MGFCHYSLGDRDQYSPCASILIFLSFAQEQAASLFTVGRQVFAILAAMPLSPPGSSFVLRGIKRKEA